MPRSPSFRTSSRFPRGAIRASRTATSTIRRTCVATAPRTFAIGSRTASFRNTPCTREASPTHAERHGPSSG
jgi:hypothetical protein